MKKISVYVKSGPQAATAYYRFIQFFDKIDCQFKYRKQLTDKQYARFMPLSGQGIIVKAIFYIMIVGKFFGYLLCDFIAPPTTLVISRNLVKPRMPFSFRLLLYGIKGRGCRIIWDFDDDILELGELRSSEFLFLSELSNKIIIASHFLKKLIKPCYYEKVIFLPTTDGEMTPFFDNLIMEERNRTYENEIKLLWVGASGSLPFVESICQYIEKAAEHLSLLGKSVSFTVVCDMPLVYEAKTFRINNIKWTRNAALDAFLRSHIGLMPLADNKQTKGKGGFKLIQYLSVGLPSIASSVGINSSILSKGAGLLIEKLESKEWTEAIICLGTKKEKWDDCSLAAIKTYNDDFSYQNNLKSWKQLLDYHENK